MLKISSILLLIIGSSASFSQQKIENLIIVTIDGLRWQEVFSGMDPKVAPRKKFNEKSRSVILDKYWHSDVKQRRKKLMPFFWSTIADKGQLYGNRHLGNKVNASNRHLVSYPGYSELFCGFADKSIQSNNYQDNPNTNLLEYLHQQPGYQNQVAAFTSWEAFNRILNEKRSKFPVIAAFDTVVTENQKQLLINKMTLNSNKPWGNSECFDVFTHFAAMEYLSSKKPKVLLIGYGNADEWAHAGKYKSYLDATNQADKWIEHIWNYLQSTPEYKDKTALLITTDHGRGKKNVRSWTKHGKSVTGADEVWFAVLSPALPARGEVTVEMQLYLSQLAQTAANLLGVEFRASHSIEKSAFLQLLDGH